MLLCLGQMLRITHLIHPRLSASAQQLPPPWEVLLVSERSGCERVGWHEPAGGWMPLEMSSSMKAQLCHRQDPRFKV